MKHIEYNRTLSGYTQREGRDWLLLFIAFLHRPGLATHLNVTNDCYAFCWHQCSIVDIGGLFLANKLQRIFVWWLRKSKKIFTFNFLLFQRTRQVVFCWWIILETDAQDKVEHTLRLLNFANLQNGENLNRGRIILGVYFLKKLIDALHNSKIIILADTAPKYGVKSITKISEYANV